MTDYSRTQAAAPVRQHAETGSVHGDQRHQFPALIAMAEAEGNGLQHNSANHRVAKRGKLTLQIATKNQLLAEASGHRERHPNNHFEPRLRQHLAHGRRWNDLKQIDEPLHGTANNEDECDADANVAEHMNSPRP